MNLEVSSIKTFRAVSIVGYIGSVFLDTIDSFRLLKSFVSHSLSHEDMNYGLSVHQKLDFRNFFFFVTNVSNSKSWSLGLIPLVTVRNSLSDSIWNFLSSTSIKQMEVYSTGIYLTFCAVVCFYTKNIRGWRGPRQEFVQEFEYSEWSSGGSLVLLLNIAPEVKRFHQNMTVRISWGLENVFCLENCENRSFDSSNNFDTLYVTYDCCGRTRPFLH